MAKWGEGDPRWIVEERSDSHNVNNWHWKECGKFEQLIIFYSSLPETSSRGGLIPEMIQVGDYDILIVLGELNTLI